MRRHWFAAFLTLTAAFGLKLAYSRAGAAELEWVLGPSCWLARQLGGLELTHEVGAGWITHRPRMVVGPACAGVNFLVVSWLALFFSAGRRRGLGWCVGSLLLAYVATLGTNALRIVLAARLYELPLYAGWLTPARLHRLLGVVLYCSVLFGLCRVGSGRTRLAPLYWYAGVMIGVPLLNRSFLRDPAQFAEHTAMTLGVGLALLLAFRLIGRFVDRLSWSSWPSPKS
ncbi:MAG TPA: exosortase K [Polyangiales bacterium]|nr:exosortase K [Polyangiales bacterium]